MRSCTIMIICFDIVSYIISHYFMASQMLWYHIIACDALKCVLCDERLLVISVLQLLSDFVQLVCILELGGVGHQLLIESSIPVMTQGCHCNDAWTRQSSHFFFLMLVSRCCLYIGFGVPIPSHTIWPFGCIRFPANRISFCVGSKRVCGGGWGGVSSHVAQARGY